MIARVLRTEAASEDGRMRLTCYNAARLTRLTRYNEVTC